MGEASPTSAPLAKLASVLPAAQEEEPAPGPGARLVVQVSRWGRVQDMTAVMAGLSCAEPPQDVHLMLAATVVTGVTDAPEGAEVLAEHMTARPARPPIAAAVAAASGDDGG